MIRKIAFLILVLVSAGLCGQHTKRYSGQDSCMVRNYLDSVKGIASPGELTVKAALLLLNTPYVAQTLEGNANESLVVNLQQLDCMTLVENCLALSRAAQSPHPDYEAFVRELQAIRYRGGILNGYTSRLHYTSDWITDNAGMGVIEDVTEAVVGKRFRPQVDFMSSHPERYPALKDNLQAVKEMAAIEQAINQRNTYYYIPKNEIQSRQSQIESGDIIGFTTRIPGLDISHVAIAYWKQGRLGFIHASTQYMKVVVEPKSLEEYCRGIKTNTGIVVLRGKEVQE
jgi:hypothetical protein